jgi:CDP-diacylglycerol--glycerol-3-phosphate 3-phosphatidyltransferase
MADPQTTSRPPRRERVRAPIGAGARREMMKDRLIESRLTPNAISITGLILNVVAAVLVWQELYIVGGIAFIVGSVCDTLDVLASLMVSYTRARAEALGVECKVGIASRAVRVVILSIGILFADLGLLAPSVYVLAGLGTITVLQRIFHVRSELRASGQTA